jgi:hypothetical protein
MNPREAQELIDSVINDGATIVHRKRRYDSHQFSDLWQNRDGMAVYGRLITNTRKLFIRYLDIPTSYINDLISASAGFAVDMNSQAYEVMYTRINEWKKNWFSLYAQGASTLQKELAAAHHWTGLGKAELVAAYTKVYAPEYIITLFQKIHAGMIDWRASLRNVKLDGLYKTLFTYSMV